MTYQSLERDCDYRAHRGRGAWDEYVRVFHVRRRKCSHEARTDFEIFREMVDLWRRETWYKSSINRRISHPAYLKIIGFGPKAVPWILQELRQEPDYWFAALEAITRDNPSPNATSLPELRTAWLGWGEAHGY